jgi:hypothetical protein
MEDSRQRSDEAMAVERVAAAAREVQLASHALEEQFGADFGRVGSTLPLARLTAAISELQAARDALDVLLARKSMH